MTNKLIRKLRSDASWNKLSNEQRQKLESWLFDDNLGYEEAQERAKAEFGFEGSRSAVRRFYKSRAEVRFIRSILSKGPRTDGSELVRITGNV